MTRRPRDKQHAVDEGSHRICTGMAKSVTPAASDLPGNAHTDGEVEADPSEGRSSSSASAGILHEPGMHFLVASRLTGIPWSNVEDALSEQDRLAIASRLGHALAHIHSLPCPLPNQHSSPLQADITSLRVSRASQAPSGSLADRVNEHAGQSTPASARHEVCSSVAVQEGSDCGVQEPTSPAELPAASHSAQDCQRCQCDQHAGTTDAQDPLSQSLSHLRVDRDAQTSCQPSSSIIPPGAVHQCDAGRQQQQQPMDGGSQRACSLDAAWQPVLQQLEQKLEVLQGRLADPEGPAGLQGVFPAHLWRQLRQELPTSAAELLSPASQPQCAGPCHHSGSGTYARGAPEDDSHCSRSSCTTGATTGHRINGLPGGTDQPEEFNQICSRPAAPTFDADAASRQQMPQVAASIASLHAAHSADQADHSAEQQQQQQKVQPPSNAKQTLATNFRPVWLHNDLSCCNVLLHREASSHTLSGIELLDFGDALPGHPLVDFVVLHFRGFRCFFTPWPDATAAY